MKRTGNISVVLIGENTRFIIRHHHDLTSYKGFFDVDTAYPEWFSAIGEGKTDDTKAIQDAMDVSNSVSSIKGKAYAVKSNTLFKHSLHLGYGYAALPKKTKRIALPDETDIRDGNVMAHKFVSIVFLKGIEGYT